MALGDSQAWASQFVSVDERLLERIAFVWPACVAVLPSQPKEDIITFNLVDLLWRDPVARSIGYVECHFEPFGTCPNGAKFRKGIIDMAVVLDWDREHYLAYECKRLNVVHSGKRSSLATDYVTDGMMRFITEQYAEGLPIGCMLGYVMDGDIPFAMNQLENAITSQHALCLISGPTSIAPTQSIERFITTHTRATTTTIEIRHALLPYTNYQ